MDRFNSKRPRSPPLSISSSSSQGDPLSRSPTPPPAPKYHRFAPAPIGERYTCNLPPTCSQPSTSTSFTSPTDLERHQAIFHQWVCRTPIPNKQGERPPLRLAPPDDAGVSVPERFVSRKGQWEWMECGKVFPDERMLNLHQTETHDPIAREKQDRGEKIFQCFLPLAECKKLFETPGKRRRHLIDKHRYPPDYFFSVTNHGINRIAQQDGLGFTLIRPRIAPQTVQVGDGNDTPAQETSSPVNCDHDGDTDVRKEAPLAGPGDKIDTHLDDLIDRLGGLDSSLAFVPRGVKKKGSGKN